MIVSDAIIRDNVFEFLKHRTPPLLVNNLFKKFEGVPAKRIRNEENFLNEIKEHIQSDQPFLFGGKRCDEIFVMFLSISLCMMLSQNIASL